MSAAAGSYQRNADGSYLRNDQGAYVRNDGTGACCCGGGCGDCLGDPYTYCSGSTPSQWHVTFNVPGLEVEVAMPCTYCPNFLPGYMSSQGYMGTYSVIQPSSSPDFISWTGGPPIGSSDQKTGVDLSFIGCGYTMPCPSLASIGIDAIIMQTQRADCTFDTLHAGFPGFLLEKTAGLLTLTAEAGEYPNLLFQGSVETPTDDCCRDYVIVNTLTDYRCIDLTGPDIIPGITGINGVAHVSVC